MGREFESLRAGQFNMKRKIAIIGKGTGGALSAAYTLRAHSRDEIVWYYDPAIPTQAVGEGTTLQFPQELFASIGFTYWDLEKELDGSLKLGLWKEGWGKEGKFFFHDFMPPYTALHFNAHKLQDYVVKTIKDKVKIKEENISHDRIDADAIIDCTGRPPRLVGADTDPEFNISEYIPVNSVYVTQCWWDAAAFQYTLTIAKKHGWVFGIPLRNRCSIGYLYNNKITSLEEVKEDVQSIFKQFNLTPSDTTNSFSFNNYYRKKNFDGRVTYNGNASFFLEPIEATSFANMLNVLDLFTSKLDFKMSDSTCNALYHELLVQMENMIMLHYFAGSTYDTPFWKFAKDKGNECMKVAIKDEKFRSMIQDTKKVTSLQQALSLCQGMISPYRTSIKRSPTQHYGNWWLGSYWTNLKGMGIDKALYDMLP